MGRKPDLEARQRILRQAEHQFHLSGYHGTSMDAIAQACEMTKANLFHHYGSKEELALAVLEDKISSYRTNRVQPLCSQGDPIEAVGAMFTEAGQFFDGIGCKAGCFIANIGLEMADVNEEFRRRVGEFFAEWSRGMADCLAKCQQAGGFDAELDPQAAADSIVALYEGAVMMARTRRDAAVFDRVGKLARELLQKHKTSNYDSRRDTMGPKTPCGC